MFDPLEPPFQPDDPAEVAPFGDKRDADIARMVMDDAFWLCDALDEVDGFLDRFMHFEHQSQRHAVTLWIIHSYVFAAFDVCPYLHITSPEKRSGKTLLLDLIEQLARSPIATASITPAVLYRLMDDEKPTLLIDEADAIFGQKHKRSDDAGEALRGLIDAGFRRGRPALRMGGPRFREIERFDAFGPKALAGIGDLPDTIADRCIPIRLQRKPPSISKERFRFRVVRPQAQAIADKLELVLLDMADYFTESWPDLPEQLHDRAQDLWEPLLAIADTAGAAWSAKARAAAVDLHTSGDGGGATIGVQLLEDVRSAFGDDELIFTERLLLRLHALDESPWGDWYGKKIDGRFLGQKLGKYGIKSKNIRIGADQKKGYSRSQFVDSWDRYVTQTTNPSLPSTPKPSNDKQNIELASPHRPSSVPLIVGRTEDGAGTSSESPGTPHISTHGTDGTVTLDGAYNSDRCRCGRDVDRYTGEGFPYCNDCGEPNTQDLRSGDRNQDAERITR